MPSADVIGVGLWSSSTQTGALNLYYTILWSVSFSVISYFNILVTRNFPKP